MAGNPFYVAPAGDMSQGLQGLGQALQYATEQKEEREAKEAERKAQVDAQTALYDATQLPDPEARVNAVMDAAIQHPSLSKQAEMALGLAQKYQKDEAAQFATEVLASPEKAAELAQRRISVLQALGRDPSHTIDFLETLQQDPEAAMQGLKMNFAMIDPDGYKAFKDLTEAKAAEGFTLAPGAQRYDAQGNLLVTNPAAAKDAPAGYELIPAAEAAAMGLPPTSSYQRNIETGQISGVGGAQTVVNNNMGQATEGERTAGILANRLDFAKSQIDEILQQSPEAQSPGALPTMLEGAGMNYLARVSNPAERQIVEAAQEDMLDAALTLGTGAAYTKEQLQGYKKSYFPQLGDDQKTIEAKAGRLRNLIDAAYTKAGRGAPAARRSAQGDVVAVNSQAEYDALPPGSVYLEDGIQYRKP